MKKIFLSLFATMLFLCSHAQVVSSSTSQVISSKAAKGELFEYFINEETSQIELVYKIKESKKKVLFETYYFNKTDLKFIKSEETEIEKEKVKRRRGKVKKGQNIKLLKVMPNLLNGQIKLAKGTISYSYAGRAVISHFNEEMKVKPKGEDGDRMVYLHHRTEEPKLSGYGTAKGFITMGIGNVMVLAIENSEPLYGNITAMVYDAHTLNQKHRNKIDLGNSYKPLCVKDLPNGNMGILLESYTMANFPKPKHNQKIMAKHGISEKYHLKYIEINTKCELVHNVNAFMPKPESGNQLSMSINPSEDGNAITIIGCKAPLKILGPPLGRVAPVGVNQQLRDISLWKADKLWTIAIENGKILFAKEHPLNAIALNAINSRGAEEFVPKTDEKSASKNVKPGGGVLPRNVLIKDGKILLYLTKRGDYQQIIQFDREGNIEANYIFTNDKKHIVSQEMQYITNSKGEFFLISFQQPSYKADDPGAAAKSKEKMTAEIVKLDIKGKAFGKPVGLTPGASFDIYDGLVIEDENNLLTLGNGRKKEIVLSRITLK